MTRIQDQYKDTKKLWDLYSENTQEKFTQVKDIVNEASKNISDNAFTRLSVVDVRCVIDAIDKVYLGGYIKDIVGTNLLVELSNRMTSSAGSIRTNITFYTFLLKISKIIFLLPENRGGYTVNGLFCQHRLDALISVVQHELAHMIDYIFFFSSGHGSRFKGLAHNLFGHITASHEMHTPNSLRLSTPKEVVAKMFGNDSPYTTAANKMATTSSRIYVGATVSFKHGGTTHQGEVKRITKRATVIIGPKKWYVPVKMLTLVTKKIIKVKLANLNG